MPSAEKKALNKAKRAYGRQTHWKQRHPKYQTAEGVDTEQMGSNVSPHGVSKREFKNIKRIMKGRVTKSDTVRKYEDAKKELEASGKLPPELSSAVLANLPGGKRSRKIAAEKINQLSEDIKLRGQEARHAPGLEMGLPKKTEVAHKRLHRGLKKELVRHQISATPGRAGELSHVDVMRSVLNTLEGGK